MKNMDINTGWLCPVCCTIYSPHVMMCNLPHSPKVESVESVEPKVESATTIETKDKEKISSSSSSYYLKPFILVGEASRILGVSDSSIREIADNGLLKVHYLNNTLTRYFDRKEVLKFKKSERFLITINQANKVLNGRGLSYITCDQLLRRDVLKRYDDYKSFMPSSKIRYTELLSVINNLKK